MNGVIINTWGCLLASWMHLLLSKIDGQSIERIRWQLSSIYRLLRHWRRFERSWVCWAIIGGPQLSSRTWRILPEGIFTSKNNYQLYTFLILLIMFQLLAGLDLREALISLIQIKSLALCIGVPLSLRPFYHEEWFEFYPPYWVRSLSIMTLVECNARTTHKV